MNRKTKMKLFLVWDVIVIPIITYTLFFIMLGFAVILGLIP